MRSYQIEGIVLKRFNIGESDRLVTLFTKDRGKIVALARGIRKIHSRKSPHLELFSSVRCMLHRGKRFDYIVEAQTQAMFSSLRRDFSRIALAFHLIEAVDRLCLEGQESQKIFFSLLHILHRIDNEKTINVRATIDTYCRVFLQELGYLPYESTLSGISLDQFLERIIERSVKSTYLLARCATI